MSELEKIAITGLHTLNEVTAKLLKGMDVDECQRQYRGKFIVPGVTVSQHVRELDNGGCLIHRGNTIRLRSKCDPRRIFRAA